MKVQSFNCPECERSVPTSCVLAGQLIVCPNCVAEISVPSVILPPHGRELNAKRGIQPELVPAKVQSLDAVEERRWGGGGKPVTKTTHLLQRQFPLLWRLRAKIGLVLVLVSAGGILIALSRMGNSRADPDGPVVGLASPLSLPPADQFDPSKTVHRFIDVNTSTEQRIELLRPPFDAELVRDQLVSTQPDWESGIESVDYLGQAQMLDLGYHGYYVRFRNGQERYLCAVEQTDGFRLDWNAYARPGAENSWTQLLNGDVEANEIRVFLVPANYYNYAFSDHQEHSSFVLSAPDSNTHIFGYARRHTATEKIILEAVQEAWSPTGLRPILMTLRLERIDQSHEGRQFLIAHVVATSWVVSNVGTVQDLWVNSDPGSEVTDGEIADLAGVFDAPLMFQQGLNLKLSDTESAARFFRNALENQESFFPARLALADILAEQGKLDEAETELKAILIREETNVEAHYQLAICALKRDDMQEAILFLESTVRLAPNHAEGLNNLSWLLATHRDKSLRTQSRVVKMAEHAVMLGLESQPSFQATLAVAYAAVGRFEEAVETTEKALRILRESGSDRELEDDLTTRLKLFSSGQVYDPNRR